VKAGQVSMQAEGGRSNEQVEAEFAARGKAVILGERLKAAALRLNPGLPEDVIDPRRAMNLVAANREFDSLLRDGITDLRSCQPRQEVGGIDTRPRWRSANG
jgi:hypothetical protein